MNENLERMLLLSRVWESEERIIASGLTSIVTQVSDPTFLDLFSDQELDALLLKLESLEVALRDAEIARRRGDPVAVAFVLPS